MLGLHTDHIINAPVSCYVILSLLFSSMLVYGYVPDELLRSTIVPIPKNNLGNLCSSENYRGIALCNPILKLFECIIYKAHCCSLTTYENQFAFKECHSTVTCTVVLKETVTYYRERNMMPCRCHKGFRPPKNMVKCFKYCSRRMSQVQCYELCSICV